MVKMPLITQPWSIAEAPTTTIWRRIGARLRNIEKTGPYFHDGKTATLDAAVFDMGEYQLGRKLTDQEVKQIVVFLRTMTGQLPTDYIKEPALPKSTAKTPKPDLR